MADPIEVRRLLLISRAASMSQLRATSVQNRMEAAREARIALQALQAALSLDPTREAPAWRDGTPRDVRQVGDGMLGYYIRYVARAAAAGL